MDWEIGALNGHYDDLLLTSRSIAFFTYSTERSEDNKRRITIVDFSQGDNSMRSRPAPSRSRFLPRFWARRSKTYRRDTELEIEGDAQYAMHPGHLPYFAYFQEGMIQVRHLYETTTLRPRPSISPFPLIWLNDSTLEFTGIGNLRIRWDILRDSTTPDTTPRHPSSLRNNLLNAAVTTSANRRWALIIDPELAATSEVPAQVLYDAIDHSFTSIPRPTSSRIYATLTDYHRSKFLVSVEDVDPSERPCLSSRPGTDTVREDMQPGYRIVIKKLIEEAAHPIMAHQLVARRPLHRSAIDTLRSVNSFSEWGLVSLIFEHQTHLYAMTPGDRLYCIAPAEEEANAHTEDEIFERIIVDCQRRVQGTIIACKEQLLTLSGHAAITFADFIERCISRLAHDDERFRPAALSLLQDICYVSGQLPSSYWVPGHIDLRRYISGDGQTISEEGVCTIGAQSQQVVARRLILQGYDWRSEEGTERLKTVHRELIILKQLNHINIVPILGVWRDERCPAYIIHPSLRHDVVALLRSRDVNFDRVLRGVLRGLEYLHTRKPNVIHGDLHPGSILVTDQGSAALSDFGLSRIRHEITRSRTMVQKGMNSRYSAPELGDLNDEGRRTTKESDIFSCAMVTYHLGSLTRPFDGMSEAQIRSAIKAGKRPLRPTVASNLDDPLWSLTQRMWDQRPHRRPTIQAVVKELAISNGDETG